LTEKNKSKKLKELHNIPTGKYWKEVLIEIDKFAPNNYGESSDCYIHDDNHLLAKKLNISGQELGLAISYLTSMKLIDKYDTNPNSKRYEEMIFINPQGSLFVRTLEQQKLNQKQLDLNKQQIEQNNQMLSLAKDQQEGNARQEELNKKAFLLV